MMMGKTFMKWIYDYIKIDKYQTYRAEFESPKNGQKKTNHPIKPYFNQFKPYSNAHTLHKNEEKNTNINTHSTIWEWTDRKC